MKKVHIEFRHEDRDDIHVVFSASVQDEEVISLIRRISDPFFSTLTVYDDHGCVIKLPEEMLISISAENKKLLVRSDIGVYEARQPLYEVEKQLHPAVFLRISRYEIIHLGKVRKFDFSITGSLRIEMTDGSETWASRRFISVIRARLKQHKEDL